MDIIFHRNCLDGVFSAHLFYLISKVITSNQLQELFKTLNERINKKQKLDTNDGHFTSQYQKLTDLNYEMQKQFKNDILNKEQKHSNANPTIIDQNFFHQPNKGINYCSYSIFAGQFIPLKFPSKNKILLILDTGLVKYENLLNIGQKYDYVIVIDHHTSFQPIKKDILLYKNKMKKLFYVFSEDYCATELCFQFLQKYFNFENYFEQKHIENLKQIISYVGANDRKHMESKQSKQFTLGFYYFDIQLSHLNPLLNKRLGMINLQYLMEKGLNLYKAHLKEIADEISKAEVCKLQISGKLKNAKFYFLKPSNASKISDIGIVLSYLSKRHQMENLAILYMQRSAQIRISARSHRSLQNPLALQLAQKFQGGGHICAAGFKTQNNKFKSLFTRLPAQKSYLLLKPQQIQEILFFNNHSQASEKIKQE